MEELAAESALASPPEASPPEASLRGGHRRSDDLEVKLAPHCHGEVLEVVGGEQERARSSHHPGDVVARQLRLLVQDGAAVDGVAGPRSEERRVGKGGGRTCRFGWSRDHKK